MPKPTTAGGTRGVSQDRILDVALRIFAEKGYLGTNLGDVSDELGVTRQAIYYHFTKKHDILNALFMRLFDDLETAADQAEAGATDANRFESLMRAHIGALARRPELAVISVEESRQLPKAQARKVLARRERYLERFFAAYEAGAKSGSLKPEDSRVAVQLAMGSANWLGRWYKPAGAKSPDEITEDMLRMLIGGLGQPA